MFKNREEFEEALAKSVEGMQEELEKARDPFTDFPSKKPESAVDKKSREITDKMRERAGAKDKLKSDVKAHRAGEPTIGNDDYGPKIEIPSKDIVKAPWSHPKHGDEDYDYARNKKGVVHQKWLTGPHTGKYTPN